MTNSDTDSNNARDYEAILFGRQPVVGAAIKRIREQRGLTQSMLAVSTSIMHSTAISKYENGVCNPRPKARYRLAKALGLSDATRLEWAAEYLSRGQHDHKSLDRAAVCLGLSTEDSSAITNGGKAQIIRGALRGSDKYPGMRHKIWTGLTMEHSRQAARLGAEPALLENNMNPYHDHDKHPTTVPDSYRTAILFGILVLLAVIAPGAVIVLIRWLFGLATGGGVDA